MIIYSFHVVACIRLTVIRFMQPVRLRRCNSLLR